MNTRNARLELRLKHIEAVLNRIAEPTEELRRQLEKMSEVCTFWRKRAEKFEAEVERLHEARP